VIDQAPIATPLPLQHPPSFWLARIRVIARASVHRCGRGQILIREGDRPSCFWVIQRGAVALTSTAPSGPRATLAVLGRGGAFGEQGLHRPFEICGPQNVALLLEARTLASTTLQAVPFSELHTAMAADRELAWWVAAAVGRRAAWVERALARTLMLRVPLRVLGVLRDLADDHGKRCPDGVRIELSLSQDLLASMVGASRESVNRAIAELQRRGLVRRIGLLYVLSWPAPDPLDWPPLPAPSGSSSSTFAGGPS